MADRFYGVNRGHNLPVQVLEQGTTTSRPIELRVNDSVYTTKLDVILGLEALLHYLRTRETNPIA